MMIVHTILIKLPLLVAGNILSSTFGKRKIFLILAISCLLKPSFDGLILLTNFGIEGFHLEPSNLIKLFKDKPELKENTIIAVSNSNSDGVSALQKHYKFNKNDSHQG
jgi:hypothetical protein